MLRALGLALLATVVGPAAAAAAPANDAPADAAAFQSVTAENGTPTERQAIVVLDGAGPDEGVPRCLGGASFQRTAWLRIESSASTRRLRIDASGETTNPPDLAAFVQPAGATDPAVSEPQACDGAHGPGGLAGQGSSSVDLRVPAGRQVLVQVGRPVSGGQEAVLATVAATVLSPRAAPVGDDPAAAPAVGATVPLAGATLGEADPALPRCPAAGTVWRQVTPAVSGPLRVRATGADTLALFAPGPAPTGDSALACDSRAAANAPIELTVTAAAGQPLWLRLGADDPAARAATVTVGDPAPETPPSGGGGGAVVVSAPVGRDAGPTEPPPAARTDTAPSTTVPAPASACTDVLAPSARVTGFRAATRRLSGRATDRGCAGLTRVQVAITRVGSSKRTWRAARGTTAWSLTLPRALKPGRYRVAVRARDGAGNTSVVTTRTLTLPRRTA